MSWVNFLGSPGTTLRTLESGEVRRVGGHQVEYPDVRIIAATNRNLVEMVEQDFSEGFAVPTTCPDGGDTTTSTSIK